MSALSTIVITTRLPPQICGIGTYSWLLHKYRPKDSMPAQFFVMEGALESRALLGWNAITDFHGDPRKLEQALNCAGATNVLLHYAGRGYQRFGCPIWLPSVLRNWKAKFPNGHLTIFFHEVPGELPRRSRHFLLGKINARIVRQLATLADVLATNTDTHAAILRRLSGRNGVHCFPVGSNIEPVATSLRPRAETEFVIFGLPFGRWQTLRAFEPQIRKWHESGLLTKLHLIGPEDERLAARVTPLLGSFSGTVVRHGKLAEADVSQLLGHARFAFTNVTLATWSKSGAFMACAAHSCAVVIKEKEIEVPLCYAIAENEIGHISAAAIETRPAALKKWYEENATWSVIAHRLAVLSQANGALR
jgi:hypothetical protein